MVIPLVDQDLDKGANHQGQVIAWALMKQLPIPMQVKLTNEAGNPINQLLNTQTTEGLNYALSRLYDWADHNLVWLQWPEATNASGPGPEEPF